MAQIEGPSANIVEVEASKGARVVNLPRAVTGSYKLAAFTGVIAAAAAQNGCFYAQRIDSGTTLSALIERIRLQYTTIVAYTTPVTAARRLEIYRGSGAASSGGTDISPTDNSGQTDSNYGLSECYSGQGGSTRIATTGTLTVTGITFETQPFGVLALTHVGAAGGNYDRTYEFDSAHEKPMILRPGELLAVRNPVAMDAAGTWQLGVEVEWSELTP